MGIPKCLCWHPQQVAPDKWPTSITPSLCLHYIIVCLQHIITSYISIVHLGGDWGVCMCDWHLDNIYLSHFNVLSIQSGTPALAAKPLCGQAEIGQCPSVSLESVKFRRADLRGRSTTALQGLSFSPNTRWCGIYPLFLPGIFFQESCNCLRGKEEPQVHHGLFL